MAGLAEVVSGLAARDGVRVVVVLSEDGLAIEKAAPAAVDVDSLAALSASVVQYANRLGTGTASGALRTAVLEYEGALLVIELVGSGESRHSGRADRRCRHSALRSSAASVHVGSIVLTDAGTACEAGTRLCGASLNCCTPHIPHQS